MVSVGDTGLDVEVVDRIPPLDGILDAYKGRERADALMVPEGYAGVVNEQVRALMVQTRYGKVVKTDSLGRLHTRGPVGGLAFTTGNPSDTMYYPKTDPFRPGQSRYDWYVDSDDFGVRYGFLKE